MGGYLTAPEDDAPGAAKGGGYLTPPDDDQGSFLDRTIATGGAFARGLGLNTRNVTQGLLSPVTFPLDVGINAGNLFNRVTQPGRDFIGLPEAGQVPTASEMVDRGLSGLGVAEPQTPGERIVGDILRAASGAG